MNENEITTTENNEVVEVAEECSELGTGTAMLIGAGILAAGYAGVKGAKKLWAKIKEKRELKKATDGDYVEVEGEIISEEKVDN